MYRSKLIAAALASTLAAGAMGATAAVALAQDGPKAPHARHHAGKGDGPRREAMREVAFVRMLKQFDTDKDGKISREEGKAGIDKVFAEVDANKDGTLTPGEMRQYREARMKAMAEARKAAKTADADEGDGPDDAAKPPRDGGPGRHHARHGGPRGGMMMAGMMRQVDSDENGQISRQEADAAFDKFFTRMDVNKDGVISIDDMPNRPFL